MNNFFVWTGICVGVAALMISIVWINHQVIDWMMRTFGQ